MSKQYPGGIISKTAPVPSGPYETSTASGIWTLDQQAAYAKQGIWPTAGRLPPDPQFNYVTMLLHGDGTNGAQNNTFLDSSTNNFSITRNGNTTQGSFSPYGSGWSNYFDGTGDYLSIADNASLDMGSSSFTIEGWFLPTADVGAGKGVFGKRANNGVVGGLLFYFSSTGLTPRLLADIGGSWGVDITASSGFTLGQWNHFATVRNSNTWTIYINGTSVGSATNSGTVTDNSAAFTIMAESAAASEGTTLGYISNFRVVKGTAVYTANFTPSTTPLTAITNTSLLTCQSNRFIDNSTNNFTITRNGDTSVQRFNPFGTSTAYSTSVIGGSGYFDGSGDYLALPSTSQATLTANSNFTFETYLYLTGYSGTYNGIWGGNGGDLVIAYSSNNSWGIYPALSGSAPFMYSGMTVLNGMFNRWAHVALTRSGNSWNLWVDGVSVASATQTSTSIPNTTKSLGSEGAGANPMKGYMTDARYTNAALYSTTFTPTSTPLTTTVSSGTVQLLTKFTNGAIYDNAMMNNLETVGNAQISTSVKKYGTGSIYMAANGDYLAIPSSQNFNFGSGNFTVEMWAYVTTLFDYQQLFTTDGTNAGGASFGIDSAGSPLFYLNDFYFVGPTASITTNTWVHIAFVRSSGVVKAYTNGVGGTGATVTASNAYANPRVGSNLSSSGQNIKGYIDDLRITKGYARYTANFTPPTSAFPDIGPT